MVTRTLIRRLSALTLATAATGALAGCGLEAHIADLIAGDNPRLVVELRGALPEAGLTLDDVELTVASNDGTPLPVCAIGVRGEACIVESAVEGKNYVLTLEKPAGLGYEKLVLGARVGDVNYQRFAPIVKPVSKDLDLTLRATLVTRLIEAILSKSGRSVLLLDPATIQDAINTIAPKFSNEPAHQELLAMAERLVAAGDPDAAADAPALFQTPAIDAEGVVTTSPINAEWLGAREVDIDDDGTVDEYSTPFDEAFAAAADLTLIEECVDPDNIRVVLAVDFNEGNVDENCTVLNRFRWVVDNAGDSMWFVGGIHEESPVQSTEVDALLGNSGSWAPNTVPMYDDGSNGDEVASDGVWTVAFTLPRGVRIGYKYTWGVQGQLWTGTEEWPGNQRLLEAVDVNGDDVVFRYDNFADETTNKDRASLNNKIPGGSITWDSDINEDGIPDPQERPVDQNEPPTCGDPADDTWLTPRGVGPAIVPCD